jgi:hypothetical protein
MLPSIRVNTQWACDRNKGYLSDEISFESVDERWNGCPVLIKHKSNLIDGDKQQLVRI